MDSERVDEIVLRDETVGRLQAQLQQTSRLAGELELQVLNSRDHALGQSAEIGELRFRLVKQAATYEERMHELSTHIFNHVAHIARLESALGEATRRVVALEEMRNELIAVRSSTTWRLGRLLMLPIRIVKRLVRRG